MQIWKSNTSESNAGTGRDKEVTETSKLLVELAKVA